MKAARLENSARLRRVADLLADDDLVAVIVLAAPGRRELRGT